MDPDELIANSFEAVDTTKLDEVLASDADELIQTCIAILEAHPDVEDFGSKMGAFHIIEALWWNHRDRLGDNDKLSTISEALIRNDSEVEDTRLGAPCAQLAREIAEYVSLG